jgi:hypothetical protein
LRADLSDTILKRTHLRTVPARFGLIWFRGFRGECESLRRRTPSDGKSSGELNTALDHSIAGNFNINAFNKFFGINNKIKEREIIETKTTLETYKTFFVDQGAQQISETILKNSRYQDLSYWQEPTVCQ